MTCSEYIAKNAQHTLKTIEKTAGFEPAGAIMGAADMAFDYLYPICPNFGNEPFPTAQELKPPLRRMD